MYKISPSAKQRLKEIDIVDVISTYLILKQRGNKYIANCPFHSEKTPSFTVYPETNTYHCYGCGAHGDAISFVQEKENLSFVEASQKLASEYNLEIGSFEEDPDREKKARILEFLAFSKRFFQKHLEETTTAFDYAMNRFKDKEIISFFGLGYAPKNGFIKAAEEKGFTIEEMKQSGLVAEGKDGQPYEYFRERLMFPICNAMGKTVGYTGRYIGTSDNKKIPKYLNTPETLVFKKGELLYNWHVARKKTYDSKEVIIVEGPTDTITLYRQDVFNVVAVSGTALTDKHIDLLSNYTDSLILLLDGDEAGQKAKNRIAEKIIEKGLPVRIIQLPAGIDPDEFFSENSFEKYQKENQKDFIEWKAEALKDADAVQKQKIISELALLIKNFPGTLQEIYIEQLSKNYRIKKVLTDSIKELNKVKEKPLPKEELPDDISFSQVEKYGFYESKNQLYFRTKKGIERGANFQLKPIFHVQSPTEAKRIFEITNENGFSLIIELNQRDLISLSAFRLRVESLGNFLWELGEIELNRLKRYLYEKTQSCKEVVQLGWQKQGCWAFSNGIIENGIFREVNQYGIVDFSGHNLYIPAYSKIYDKEDTLFMDEKKFRYVKGSISMADFYSKMVRVFGENAKVGFAFLFATVFRDVVINRIKSFPLLNLFGVKGTGKTEMAWCFLQFFGKLSNGPNLNNTSKPSLADHVAKYANAVVHLDEYKNSLDFEKIEFLKGIWDGTGRTRMNMDKDRKKETTAVDCGVILSGQEMPTVDIALFSRILFISFFKNEYSESDREEYTQLNDILKQGITHLLVEIINLRQLFIQNFGDTYNKVSKSLKEAIGNEVVIEERIFQNWALITAAWETVTPSLQIPASEDEFIHLVAKLCKAQNDLIKRGDEIANFWSTFEHLVREGKVVEEIDFLIRTKDKESFGRDKTEINFMEDYEEPVKLLYIHHTGVISKYLEHFAQTREKPLTRDSLENYLSNSKQFIGKKINITFKKKGDEYNTKRFVTTGLVFNYQKLNTDYGLNVEYLDKEESTETEENNNLNNDLPF